MIATVICGVGLLIGSLTPVSQPVQVARQSSASSRVDAEPKIENVGRITGMVDCKWEGSGVRGQGSGAENQKSEIRNQKSHVVLGDTFALSSGLMEITYDTGAKVILQGPVSYEVESKDGGYLSLGKLTARMEKNDECGMMNDELRTGRNGNHHSSFITHPLFVVRTPTATVTDLGTEFGVEVARSGETISHVFRGSIRMRAIADGNNSPNPRTVLRENESACVQDAGRNANDHRYVISRTANTPSDFVRTLPYRAADRDSEAYARLVLSLNPVVYYRMDQWLETDTKGCYVLVDSAPGAHHGVACLDEAFGKPSGRGKFGGALDFHGSMGSDYAFVKNYPKPDNGQLSVSVWVWPVVLDPWAGIVSNWYRSPTGKEIGQFGLGVSGTLELVAQIRQPDGEQARVYELGRPLPRSQWHHVAFVADGAVLRLYRNGVEIGTAPYHGIASQPARDCLSVGCGMNKDGTGPRPENAFVWNGRLDELAVFNHALSAEQVRQLYTAQAAAASGRTSP